MQHTWHLHIQGQVQGVGFRPFVYLLARDLSLKGWVNNSNNGVHVEFNASTQQAEDFKSQIETKAPILSCITSSQMQEVEAKIFEDFQIIHSQIAGETNLLISPDFALCTNCKNDLYEEGNRRQYYPFTTCTHCGPRYSIIHSLPYDRENTKMDQFEMCESCQAEYDNPENRRYYSQTNSCPDCGISLSIYDEEKHLELSQGEILDKIIASWELGKIVAIKGIGGYLLTCDAQNQTVIQTLRQRKQRPSKPFAVMFPDLTSVKKVANLSAKEEEALQGAVAPIILASLRSQAKEFLAVEEIAPKLQKLGVMLPYTPLFHLLMQRFNRPIIATSANISHSPIVFREKDALSNLGEIAEVIVQDNREIMLSQDDSVLQYTALSQEKVILRRSRGLAPSYTHPAIQLKPQAVLACGAMLKSTFSIWYKPNLYVSQYLGDLSHFDTQQNYEQSINHFLRLLDCAPEYLIADLHPNYPSTQFAQALADKLDIPLMKVQHHIAHFAAVLAEHKLLKKEERILGIVWDGTGLGEDQQIWGGEFFLFENQHFERVAHLEYFPVIAGDKMAREPRLSALASTYNLVGTYPQVQEKFSQTEIGIYKQVLKRNNALQTSSMGRLFDAVASLLGLSDRQSYEGEAALYLESLASSYFQKNGFNIQDSYFDEGSSASKNMMTSQLVQGILRDLKQQRSKDWIAAKFHYSLIMQVQKVARVEAVSKITFSGGVFQNALLVDLIWHYLGKEFQLYFHQQLSPNDENISFGQLAYYQIKEGQFAKQNLNKESALSTS